MKPVLGGIAVVLLLAGCRHPDAPAYPEASVPGANKVAYSDGATRTAVGVSVLQEARQSDGRLQVFVGLRNHVQQRTSVELTCEFKDAQGAVLEVSPVEAVLLGPGEST